MRDNVKIAAIQARYKLTGNNRHEENMAYACKTLDEAAKQNADIICFPEMFPGSMRDDDNYDPYPELSKKVKAIGKYVIYGNWEPAPEAPGRSHITQILLGPDGKVVGKYHRTTPPGPWIYEKMDVWDVKYIGYNEFPVFETELGVIGMCVCSEVYMPEISRILAIKGAELTFMPAGVNKHRLRETWALLVRARAIENLMYTVTCQNMENDEIDDGLAMIVGPEDDFVRSDKEDIIYMDADLKHLRWLRETSDTMPAGGMGFKSKPGIFKYWRRPEVYGDLLLPRRG